VIFFFFFRDSSEWVCRIIVLVSFLIGLIPRCANIYGLRVMRRLREKQDQGMKADVARVEEVMDKELTKCKSNILSHKLLALVHTCNVYLLMILFFFFG
jgi:hypothetical protein